MHALLPAKCVFLCFSRFAAAAATTTFVFREMSARGRFHWCGRHTRGGARRNAPQRRLDAAALGQRRLGRARQAQAGPGRAGQGRRAGGRRAGGRRGEGGLGGFVAPRAPRAPRAVTPPHRAPRCALRPARIRELSPYFVRRCVRIHMSYRHCTRFRARWCRPGPAAAVGRCAPRIPFVHRYPLLVVGRWLRRWLRPCAGLVGRAGCAGRWAAVSMPAVRAVPTEAGKILNQPGRRKWSKFGLDSVSRRLRREHAACCRCCCCAGALAGMWWASFGGGGQGSPVWCCE